MLATAEDSVTAVFIRAAYCALRGSTAKKKSDADGWIKDAIFAAGAAIASMSRPQSFNPRACQLANDALLLLRESRNQSRPYRMAGCQTAMIRLRQAREIWEDDRVPH